MARRTEWLLPRLQPGAAAPSEGVLRRDSAGLRHRAGTDFARGRADRRRTPLSAFVAAYQSVGPSQAGRTVGHPDHAAAGLDRESPAHHHRLAWPGRSRSRGRLWVDRLQAMAETNPSHLVVVVADHGEVRLPLSSSFVAEFCQRLSRQSPVLHLARNWLEQRLVEQGLSIEQLIQLDSQNQAADQVSVSHSIASLRFLSAMDWKEFVETLSRVEPRCAPTRPACMATWIFATRDSYRHAVESSPATAGFSRRRSRNRPSAGRASAAAEAGHRGIAPRTSATT
jgi:cyclic beta-1,2-glucan synthetase